MGYWEGSMWWPLDKDWVCEICEENIGLTWGFVHAQCRCNRCHAQYSMRSDDEERTILQVPRSLLKDEYREAVKKVWEESRTTLDEMTEEQLSEFMEVKETIE